MTEKMMMKKAIEIMKSQEVFLLAYDLVGSKKHPNRKFLMEQQYSLSSELLREFAAVMPSTNINTMIRYEVGFEIIVGDASWAGLNDPQAIPKIIAYTQEHYADIVFRWGVGKDGWEIKDWLHSKH